MKWGYGWGWGCRTLLPRSWLASPPPSSPPLGTTWPWECPPCAKPPRLGTKAHVCPLKCIMLSRNVARRMALQPLEPEWLFQTAFRVTGEHYLHKLPRAAFGVCVQNIQPSKLIKHAKKGEEVRSRNKSILAGNKTSYPDIPPRLAKCPGPEGPDRTRSPPGREENLQTLLPWKPLGTLGGGWPLESSGAVAAPPQKRPHPGRSQLYLATSRVPGPLCPRPPCPARRAPGALPASGCARSSRVPPCAETSSRWGRSQSASTPRQGPGDHTPPAGFHGQWLKAETDVSPTERMECLPVGDSCPIVQ